MHISNIFRNKLALCYIEDVKSKIQIRDLKSGAVVKEVPVEAGTASGFYGRRIDNEMFILMESYVNPGTVYRIGFENDKISMKVGFASNQCLSDKSSAIEI